MNKSKIKLLLNYYKLKDLYSKKSYSQCSEDLIIKYLINLLKIENVSFLDIGSNHPFALNNTYVFYKMGFNGVNIDANPYLIKQFKKYRSNDVNINVGVATEKGTLPFHIFEDHTLSTFSLIEKEKLIQQGNLFSFTQNIEVTTLNDIIKEKFNSKFPTILSIDIEGLDEDILRNTNFENSKPTIICAETTEYSSNGFGKKKTDFINFIKNLGYVAYADTFLNTIFLNKDFIK